MNYENITILFVDGEITDADFFSAFYYLGDCILFADGWTKGNL